MPDNRYSRTVYTTESGRVCPNCGKPVGACQCKKSTRSAQKDTFPQDGIIRVSLERKGRGGKAVSLITGFSGSSEELKSIAAELKRRCGTGGTVKDGIIEIQGDRRDELVALLKEMQFTVKRVGG